MTKSDMTRQISEAKKCLAGGKPDQALALFLPVLEVSPHNLEVRYGAALAQLQLGQIGDALVNLRKVAQARPDHPGIRANYALALVAARKQKPARQELVAAAALNCKSPKVLLQLSKALARFGFHHDAVQCLPTVDESLPFSQEMACIDIALEAGDRGLASLRLQALLERDDDVSVDWRSVANYAEKLNELEIAIRAFNRYKNSHALGTEDYVFYLVTLMESQDVETAQRVAVEAGKEDCKSAALATLIGRLNFLQGKSELGIECLHQAIDLDPSYGQAWLLLAQRAHKDDLEEIALRCQGAIDAAKDHRRVSIYYALGDIYRRQEQEEKAFSAFIQANQLQQQVNAASGAVYDADQRDKVRENLQSLFPAVAETRRFQSEGNDSPLFIVGMPRSGGSLLERMVRMLTGAPMNGESFALGQVSERYYSQMIGGDAPRPQDMPREAWQALAEEYWRASRDRKHLSTDKMPNNYRHLGVAMEAFPNAPIIHMRRDAKDTLWSIYRREFPAGYAYATNFDHLAHAYMDCEKMMAFWASIAPNRILTVNYEALVSTPETETKRIADFIGVPWNEACLMSHEMEDASFTFSEVQVKQPLHGDYVGRWQRFERFLAPMEKALEKYPSA